MEQMNVYLETGEKRTFAGAVDWPGWCRGGRDEASALDALFGYAQRYSCAIQPARLDFAIPANRDSLVVTERLPGNATTDFGAPAIPPASDSAPLDRAGMDRLVALLAACWQALDLASQAALGRELRKGPRGGGTRAGGDRRSRAGERGQLHRRVWRQCQSGSWPRSSQPDAGVPARHRHGIGAVLARRDPTHQPARQGLLDAALLRPPHGLAYPRPCLGDRGSHRIVGTRAQIIP